MNDPKRGPVAVVIPALNEEQSLGKVLADIPAPFRERVVVADNGSTDRTAEVARAGGAVEEPFLGRRVRIAYDVDRQVFDVEAPAEVEVIEGFWFAWTAFHPETSVYSAPEPSVQGGQ